MVTIAYYQDPTKDPVISTHPTVGAYLISQFTTRDQLLDLRFFDTELLGHEIDQSNGEFLHINDGIVVIIHDSVIPKGPETWGYILVAVLFAVVAIVLAPNIPPVNGRDQQSSTNSLGQSTNKERVNGRIDDIFGAVNKHTPPLWQVPYRIGVNNEETEVLLLCIGRGRYQSWVDRVYDGDTPVKNIPNASFSQYGPGTYPGKGIPELQIGEDITEKIGIYRKSNDLNRTELLPPNELDNSNIKWELTGSGASGLLKATSIPDGFEFTEFYQVGQTITLNQMIYVASFVTQRFVQIGDLGIYNSREVDMLDTPVDLGVNNTLLYEVTNVTTDTLTVTIPVSAPVDVVNAWAAMTNYKPVTTAYNVTDALGYDEYTKDTFLLSGEWYREYTESSILMYELISIAQIDYNNLVGVPFNNGVGPIFTPKGATEVILNFVSTNGFYKLNQNNEIAINASIDVVVYELDESGNETGNVTPYIIPYSSNEKKIRNPVFKTARLTLPYANSKVFSSRITNRDKTSSISNVDVIEWRDFYSFEPIPVDHDFGDVTLAHVIIPSNSTSQLIKERRQNLDVVRKITQYFGDGVFGPAESYPTDQFDQILIHIALDPYIGRLDLENINADGLMAIRQQMIDYFGSDEMCRFGHDFDTSKLTFQDIYSTILRVVMCKPYVQYGVYDAFFERPQSVSSHQITCRNKDYTTENRSYTGEQEYDGIEATYRSNETGVQETMYIPQNRSATNPKRIELIGCTTKLQAFRLASRAYNELVYNLFSVSFETDDFGRNIIPGKRVDSPDGTRFTTRPGATDGYRVFDGEVVEVNGLQVELSCPVVFTEGEDHYITFSKINGENMASILCTQVNDNTVLLSTIPEEPIYDGYSLDKTKFLLVSEQLSQSVALIPQTIESSVDSNGVETNKINLINYSPKYYKDDLEYPL